MRTLPYNKGDHSQPISAMELPIIHIVLDKCLQIKTLNTKGIEEFEYDPTFYKERSFLDLVTFQDRTLVQDYFEVMDHQGQYERELMCRILTYSGKANWYKIHLRRIVSEALDVGYELFLTNQTKIKLYEQFLDGEKQILESIAKNSPLDETLSRLSQIVESILEGSNSILLIDAEKQIVLPGGSSSLPNFHEKVASGIKINTDEGSFGESLLKGRTAIVSDAERGPLWEEFRKNMTESGFKACWTKPVKNQKDTVIGTFIIYYKEKRSPSAHDLKTIDFFTHLAELAITHHQIRASELHVSEEKYRMIAENTSDLIILFSREGEVLYASPSIKEVLGVHPDFLIGKNLHSPDLSLISKNIGNIKRAIRSKTKLNFITEFRNENNERVVIESNSAPILNREGEIENCVIVSRNITERHRALEEIERLHQQHDLILHAAGDGIYGIDLEGRIMFCNHSAAAMLGYRIEELIGKTIHETVISHQDRELLLKKVSVIRRLMIEKQTMHTDRELFSHRKGNDFPVEYIAAPIIEKGKVTGIVVTFRDITERRKAEEKRRRKEQNFRKLQQVLQKLNTIIHDYSLTQAFHMICEKSTKTLKVDRASVWLYSKENDSFYCPSFYERRKNKQVQVDTTYKREAISHFLEKLMANRFFIFKQDAPQMKAFNSRLRELEFKSVLVVPIYSGKQINGIVSFGNENDEKLWDFDEQNFASSIADLIHLLLEKEERLKTEALLMKTEKLSLVGELAAGVAHEIRNPLTSLKGFLQLMSERDPSSVDAQFYDIMLSEIDRINFISGELLLLAKPQAHSFTKVDLNEVCHQVLSLFETEANLHNVQFDYKNQLFGSSAAMVVGDPNQIKQVLVNVVKNAMEAMDKGGKVKIRLELKGENHFCLKIQDFGKGMPKDRLDKLGEPFYTTKEKGTGLGLMVSFRIIEAHNGSIEVESELNKGTTVRVSLPKAFL